MRKEGLSGGLHGGWEERTAREVEEGKTKRVLHARWEKERREKLRKD